MSSLKQQVFIALDDIIIEYPTMRRREIITKVTDTFPLVSSGYATTLIQLHRTQRSTEATSKFATVFKICDTRNNLPTDPFVSTRVKSKPNGDDSLTLAKAILAYVTHNELKSNQAQQLTSPTT